MGEIAISYKKSLLFSSLSPIALSLGLSVALAATPTTSAQASPCAPKTCQQNPCCAKNPCAANPCAAAAPAELTEAQAVQEWDRLIDSLRLTYARSGVAAASTFFNWTNVTTAPYQSSTHGDRYMVNIVNDIGLETYTQWEDLKQMPAGSIIAKPTISGKEDGTADAGPLFLMEKMTKGWRQESWDWKYTLITADGHLWGETGGKNSDGMAFCADCHNAMGAETDGLIFLPEENRRY